MYDLKSKHKSEVVSEIADAAVSLVNKGRGKIDIIVPVPPSNERRRVQPVLLLANAISEKSGIPLINCVRKARTESELKNVLDPDERARRLEGLHQVDSAKIEGKRLLLFDDLYRSGATMNAIAIKLYDEGAEDVMALTITQTRSNR